ncbi:hypothetical protein SCHPADRAFT_946468 [Schizopora paradoxa]|uniref:Protein kinase domain-containing protein n=1 Tax=Schizopora paradoxa TaxID=27342 RepID=A0A0H2R2H5_9AGAM|nr:hypothetical protein SCHPADRAFT_946468 [Schizopora paradoxa]
MESEWNERLGVEFIPGTKKQVADSEGVASIIYRTHANLKDGSSWVAIKSSSVRRRYCPEPHDIIKEACVLANISHHNIIEFVGSAKDSTSGTFEV